MRGCGLRGIDNSAGHGRAATVINVDGEGIGADVRISAVCSFVSVFRIPKEELCGEWHGKGKGRGWMGRKECQRTNFL
jgi:hypothetical protein